MCYAPPSFLSPASMSLEQVHQLLLLSIRDQNPSWVTAEGDCPACESYERKLGEIAAKLFKSVTRRRRDCR